MWEDVMLQVIFQDISHQLDESVVSDLIINDLHTVYGGVT
uniref:Uncharacterized protein n=1 Tax=Arundo donax TaxID=35708 RepID=A0A0A9A720_ARUDO